MASGLMYDLSTLDCLDFSSEKFQMNKLHEQYGKDGAIYAMYAGISEPRTGVYFNKRVLQEAGIDPESLYDMQADGLSLDDKRSPVYEYDIPDIIARFKNLSAEETRERTEKSFFATKDEIAENGYDLSINKYKKFEYKPVEYPSTQELMKTLRDIESEISAGLTELEAMLNG